jgi:DNA-binding NarL/FixJ family response regulator
MAAISLLIVHPNVVFRLGLEAMLKNSGVRVVAHASNGKDALKEAVQRSPGVILLADQLPDGDVFDHAKRLRTAVPAAKILMVGLSPDPTSMARAAAIGIVDFIFDITSVQELVDAIVAAATGTPPAGPSPYGMILSSLRDRSPDSNVDLTPREQQALRHIAYGLSNEEIAQSMSISIETVKEYVQNILRKLRVKDRTQAAVWAVRKGVV